MPWGMTHRVDFTATGDRTAVAVRKIDLELDRLCALLSSLRTLRAGVTAPADAEAGDVWIATGGTPVAKVRTGEGTDVAVNEVPASESIGVVVGQIVAWSGSVADVPDGWALCTGQIVNGATTPDLRGRFILGVDTEHSLLSSGGSATVTLEAAQLPAHTHGYTEYGPPSPPGDFDYKRGEQTYANVLRQQTRNMYSKGGGQPHENLPPYYALCFIMRV